VQATELACNVYGADYLPCRASLIKDHGLRPRCPRPRTKRRYWTCTAADPPGPAQHTVHSSGGIVRLFGGQSFRGSLGSRWWLWRCGQAAAGASPVTWFQVVNLVVISCRYWAAVSRWRRGRKWGDMPLKADRNRWAPPGEVNFLIARSCCRVGWWEFSALLFRYFDRRCSTLRISRRWATP
jgi:hypothetical protein